MDTCDFEDLDPTMFRRAMTAADRVDLTSHQFYAKVDDNLPPFAVFLWTQLQSVRMLCQVSDRSRPGWFPTQFMIANDEEMRVFVADLGQPTEAFVDRVRSEAHGMSAHWFFGTMLGTAHVGACLDASDPATKKLIRGLDSISVGNWYGECRSPNHIVEFGFINLDDPDLLVYAGTDAAGSALTFRDILP